MAIKVITINSETADFKFAESLKNNRQKRSKSQLFFVEGVNSINLLIENNWSIDTLIYSTEKKQSDWAKNIIKKTGAKTHLDMKYNLLKKLSDKEETSEIIALVSMPKDDLPKIKIKKNPLIVILDRPASPGNLGTIIRSCNSFLVDGIIITGHATDLYDPKTILASVGSIFSIPIVRLESHNKIKIWLDKLKITFSDLQIIGTSAKAKNFINNYDLTKPTVLLVGNETNGLSFNYKNMCDSLLKIPLFGSASSLNVGCATAIFLYEINNQRKKK